MRLLIDNLLNDATLTANNPSTAFPASNIISDRLTERARFDSTLLIDLGSTMTVTAVAYGGASTAITLQGNSTNSWGSPAFSQALTASVTFISASYRYWRISTGVTDSRIGYFYLGEYLQLPAHDYNNLSDPKNTDILSITSGRAVYNTKGIVYNTETVNFPLVTSTEYAEFETWWRSDDRARNHFFVPFEDAIADCPPYFSRITEFKPTRDQRAYGYSLSLIEAK
jgi:hypothetical protein